MGGLAICSLYVLSYQSSPIRRFDQMKELAMQHDACMRAAARAIYDACFPTEEVAPVGFEDAERYGTIHYRRAVEAAQNARPLFRVDCEAQPSLF
jgi:hypothetical protein